MDKIPLHLIQFFFFNKEEIMCLTSFQAFPCIEEDMNSVV